MRTAPVALLAALVAFAGLSVGDASAAFPGRNGKLLYIRENPEVADVTGSGVTGLELWTANADGTGQKRIIEASYQSVGEEAQWSPDGRRIAFSSDCGNKYDLSCGDIEIVGASGRGRGKITHAAELDPSGRDDSPTWSPDGTRLAFSRGPIDSPDHGVYVVHVGGGPLTRIAKLEYWSLAWSPDGRRIAFVWGRGSIAPYVGVMNADGTRASVVARGAGYGAKPDWSPDGTRLVFTKGSLSVGRICVVGAGGGRVRCLARGFEPAWSPDGQEIAFARGGDIYVMRADGTRLRNVTRTSRFGEGAPDWQPLR
jgi:Tol biopolymer transport system component